MNGSICTCGHHIRAHVTRKNSLVSPCAHCKCAVFALTDSARKQIADGARELLAALDAIEKEEKK